MKKTIMGVALAALLLVAGCNTEAAVVSDNLSKAADSFEVERRVIFFNGITDKYLLTIEGLCSLDIDDLNAIKVTCKVGPKEYKKHYLGLSDNVSYMVEQLEPAKVDPYHYRVIFRPETILPGIDLQTSNKE